MLAASATWPTLLASEPSGKYRPRNQYSAKGFFIGLHPSKSLAFRRGLSRREKI
jgi:hypothetical protein